MPDDIVEQIPKELQAVADYIEQLRALVVKMRDALENIEYEARGLDVSEIAKRALALTPADLQGKCVVPEVVLQTVLMVLCAARDGQSWHENMLKDFALAINGVRAMLPKRP